MLQRKLFSLNIALNKTFVNHIEHTHNLCIYKLGNVPLPSNLIFNKAETVTLINCNKFGINSILIPDIFPNLKRINYLSAHPGNYDIYKRFNDNIEWFFPNKRYDFYEYMMALGFGKKDNSLISQYIVNKQIIDGKTDFDISYKFDLQIPNYNIVDSEWYRQQFYEYIVKKHNEENQSGCNNVNKSNHLLQELEELHLQQEVVKKNMLHDVFENIIDNKN